MHAKGIQVGQSARRAYALSLQGGLKTAVPHANWVFDRGYERSEVPISAVERSLQTYAYNAESSPAHQAIGAYAYRVPGLQGLGGTTETGEGFGVAPWTNVLSSFLAPIAGGIGRKIAPEAQTTTIVQQAPTSKTPGWVVPAAVVGGVGLLYMLFRKRA